MPVYNVESYVGEALDSFLGQTFADGPTDSASITQRRHELGDLRDRMTTKRTSLDIVRELGSPPVEERDGHHVAPLPYCDHPGSGIPAELYRLTEHDVALLRRARTG